MTKSILFSTLCLLFLVQCKKEAIEIYDCTGVTSTYTNNIKAILDSKCATSGCHNSASQKDGKDLSSYSGALSASNGDDFLGSIQKKNGYKAMPENGSKLDEASIKLISCWVQNGAPQ